MSDQTIILCKEFILILKNQRTYQMHGLEKYFAKFHESNFADSKMRPDLDMKLDICYPSTTFLGRVFQTIDDYTKYNCIACNDDQGISQRNLYPHDNRLVIIDRAKDDIVHVFDCYLKMLY